MAFKEFDKNSRERIRVRASRYQDHDLVDIRIYAPTKGGSELVPTRRGISLNIDVVPDLIDGLLWALSQECTDDEDAEERPHLSDAALEALARRTHVALRAHGSSVHWDSIEKMVLGADSLETKWDLHFVLASRSDVFEALGSGVFRARKLNPIESDTTSHKR